MSKEEDDDLTGLFMVKPSDYLYVQSSLVVKLDQNLLLLTPDGNIEVRMEIVTDLKDVPEKYREVVLNMITSKYLNKVSFSDNPFSLCKELPKTYWWEFWKWNVFVRKN